MKKENLGSATTGSLLEIIGKYDMTLLEEPEYTDERWENGFASAFPANTCTINAHKGLADKAPDVTEFLSKYQTNSDLISEALAKMEDDGLSIDEVSTWFLQEYEDIWISWVPQDVAEKVKSAL